MAKDSKGSGQGEIQAKVNALTSGLQSLKIVINDLRQQGFQGGLIFEALSEKIGKLLTAEGALTKELEEQKIKFKNNREQLALYTKEQQKVQAAIDGTVKVIGSLTKEQIDNTKRTTKLEAEKAKGAFESGKVAEKAQLDVLEKIKLRLAQEGRIIQAIQELEQKQLESNDRVKKSAEANQKVKFKSQKAALKAEETAKKAALRANDALELQKIKSSKLSVSKREKAELDLLNKIQKRYKKGSADYIAIEKQKVKATADSLKKRDTLVKKYQESRPAPAPTAKSAGSSFLGGLKSGFNVGELGKGIGRITGLGSALTIFKSILDGVRKVLVDSFKASVNFEAQLAQLQAVTGVTNSELEKLSDNVLEVAGSTKFTSEEIVQLQTELGKLGFDPSEIIEATASIARTAQALGEQVGPVAQKVGQIIKQYNLTTSETAKVSDTLVGAINNSALSFESFGTALQYVGPLAAEVGTSFQETAIAMAVLADNGFTASRIGTGLRGILTELSSTGRDLKSVLQNLASESISFAEAIDLVGKRNAAQLITLVDNVGALDDLEESYYKVGSAAIASAQQVDTYQGNLDLLRSAINRIQISFGELLKTSYLLRVALKAIDEDGYNAALAAETLSNVDTKEFAAGLKDAADSIAELEKKREEGKIEGENSELQRRIDIEEKANALAIKLGGEAADAQVIELEAKIEAIKQTYRDVSISESQAFERMAQDSRIQELATKLEDIEEKRKNGFKATAIELKGLIEESLRQTVLDNARNEIAAEYAVQLEASRLIREDDNIELEKAVKFEIANNKRIEDLRARKLEEEKKLVDLSGEELEIQNAIVEELGQQTQNAINTRFGKEELFKLAQKSYQLEFSTTSNAVKERKLKLKDDQALLNLEIKTKQNAIDNLSIQIANTENTEETTRLTKKQKELIEEQTQSELKKAKLQEDANNDIQSYLQATEDKLKDQVALWRQAGFKEGQVRVLDQALERIKSMKLEASNLTLDFSEALAAVDGLGESFKNKFSEDLKDGVLSQEAKDEVIKSLATLLSGFDLNEEQSAALQEYLLSQLKPGKKTKEEVTKAYQDLLSDLFGELSEVAKEYNKTALENTTNRLKSELDEIKNRYETEGDIIKSQLDNQLITESQFRAKQKELRQKQLAEENSINKQIFESQKKSDLNVVAAETAESLFSNILNNFEKYDFTTAGILSILGTAAIGAAGAAKANAIQRRKFYPVRYEEGGMVNGPSHSEGGVPFTVRGQGGYEMEGGEFIVNRKAASMNRSLLEKINSSYKVPSSPSAYKFAMGGSVQATADESVNYLKAIAEATTSTAISSSKPVRAYVSSADLRTNETERRLRDKNDRI